MTTAISAASSWSSLQAKVTMPRSRSKTRSIWSTEEFDVTSKPSNQYVMLDSNKKQQETKDMERIIHDIETQRRYRTMGTRSKIGLKRQEDVNVFGSKDLSPQREKLYTFELDKSLRINRRKGDNADVSESFQDQVLAELQKMKDSQRLEFEALERLQREKDAAEHKARRLEQQLQKHERQESLKKDKSLYRSESRKFKTRNEFTIDQESSVTKSPNWRDMTMSPPPYFSAASPATSPFKRSAWPAWTGDESFPSKPRSEPPDSSSPIETKSLSRRSHSRNKARSSSIGRTLKDSQEVRRSCAFFVEKACAHAESEQLKKERAKRLERAQHAVPPRRLLERQVLAQERKSQQSRDHERQLASRMKQTKARQVPETTYLSVNMKEEEEKRKERIRLRAEDMMRSAELPPRLARSKNNESVLDHQKIRRKLQAASEEEARHRRQRSKSVPDFDKLHFEWKEALKKRRNGDKQTTKSDEFFTSRVATLLELQDKKKARKLRLQAKQDAIQQHVQRARDKLLARTRASKLASQSKSTKTEILRAQKKRIEALKHEKERERQEREAEVRERRREEINRRIRSQVQRLERIRRNEFAGTIVDVTDLDKIAKQKARDQRQQFKEAIARNKEKLLAATATRPSLMERFSTDVKRETHRRAALEAVVKSVFQKDFSTLKDVLTDDEHEVACAMIAADRF
ncbi:Uncharacterised protein family UPF0564 [Plasmopara halstedii]|uniref:Uncharacterized protein family UPF0564 n=1 Tax=Plasmopara halstedii TaxID=4781 RepID=A0A0P1AGI0_PLAHL|nr:Uncharacterised protein family UPF0564 [Plasmopara halstedii]CEG40228.1 Uncharacterised protein family UPF0564 [Plasmopara halstedii]|eukprot:XP_024576597.1 Uncharacterised protein family UPF0564 [Plasmopara halstedii]